MSTDVRIDSHEAASARRSAPEATRRTTKVFRSPGLHRLQRRHFLLCNILPLLGTVVAGLLLWVRPVPALALGLCLALWAITLFCVVAGFHRLFSHRSFKAHGAVRIVLQSGGLMAAQGSLISWVAIHRRHHECSDEVGDPHSPVPPAASRLGKLRGILHSQLLWMYQHDYPNVMLYARDLLRDPLVSRLDRHYYALVAAGVVLPGMVCLIVDPSPESFFMGMLWGGLVRIFLVSMTIGSVNSLLHTFGQRRFETRDNSRNSHLMAFVTFGDSYHNNHHAFPSSASAGLEWYHPDPAYWVIRMLSWLKLTWDIGLPTSSELVKRMARSSR